MRHFKSVAFALVATVALGAAGAGAQTPSPVPAPEYATGIPVDVVLTQAVSSETAQVGDRFSFQTKTDTKLGALDVPAGTPGHGRLAVVYPAQGDQNGLLSLQADSIDLPDGTTVWVNIDTAFVPRGHYSKKKRSGFIVPTPVGVFPIVTTKSQGNLVLDAGTPFRVATISPRREPAPLLTAAPTPVPMLTGRSPAPVPTQTPPAPPPTPEPPASPLPSPSPSATPQPAPSPTP